MNVVMNLSRPCLCALLDDFAKINARPACNVMYPPREVLLLVGCGTIASGDDRGPAQARALSALAAGAARPSALGVEIDAGERDHRRRPC